MDINWGQALGYAAAAGLWLWKHGRAVVAEAVAASEKENVFADGKLSNEELEKIAIAVVKKRLPGVPTFAIRWAIRRLCAWRKSMRARAMEEGAFHQ